MEIEEGVIRRGRDLHNSSADTKAEFNNCFILHSKYSISSLKTWLKHAYLHRSIDIKKFIFDSARLGCSAPQIADVALRVVFLLFLPFFLAIISSSSFS